MKRTHRMLRTVLPSMLALAVIAVAPGRTFAGDRAGSSPPTSENAHITKRTPGLGSPENPIPIAGTETRALLVGTASPSDRIAIYMGRLGGWLMGTPGVVLTRGGGPDPMGDLSLPMQLNVFTGGAIEAALGRSSGLYLEGGRVIMRDPIDVLGWGHGSSSEYWTSSAGLAFRF